VADPDQPDLPLEFASSILKLQFNTDANDRMNELAEKNRQGLITPSERAEMDKYLRVGSFINLMQANKLGDRDYRIVTSPAGLVSSVTEARKAGPANADNLLWNQSVIPQDRIYGSDQLAAGSDIFNGFFVGDGDIGLIENFPFDFRNGTEIAGKKWSITDTELPFTRMRANVFINTEATDASSIISPNTDTNLTMTTWEEMAIWHRFYIPYRYNSAIATRPQGIVKISGKTS
jgi:hypothetical protein